MNIALIIGAARSGTSILGELIAAHPKVDYVFEAHELWSYAGPGINDSHRLTKEHATPEVINGIRSCLERQAKNGHLLAEKNPRHVLRVPFLSRILPEAKIIHIIRDGRDVACSMVPGCGERHWSHLKPPSWKDLFFHHKGVIRCALAWKEIMEIAILDLIDVPHMQLHYEDLLNQPSRTAHHVLSYLDLPHDPAVEHFCSKIQNVTESSYHAAHQITWYRQNHKSRVGRFRENLTPEQQVEITNLLQPVLTALGYGPRL